MIIASQDLHLHFNQYMLLLIITNVKWSVFYHYRVKRECSGSLEGVGRSMSAGQMSVTQKNILTSWCAKVYCPGIANAWGGWGVGRRKKGNEFVQRGSNIKLEDLKVEFVTTGVMPAQCTEGIFENQSFPLFHSCNVYRFDRISSVIFHPPWPWAEIQKQTDRSEHNAPKCGTAAIQLLKNVSFNHDIQSILYWQAIINANVFYSGCWGTTAWLNTFLYKQHFLLLIWRAHSCIITQMCPSSGENMANEELVAEAPPKKHIQLLCFSPTGYNYSLITSVRLLTCAECCGANTVWTPAATPLGR